MKKAAKLLKDLGMDSPPIDVKLIAEKLGIEIVVSKLPQNVSAVLNPNPPIILVDHSLSENRKRFAIAHEIGHFVLKDVRDKIHVDRDFCAINFGNNVKF